MINPGDDIYIDEKTQVFSKPRKGRKYIGKYSSTNKESIEEGQKMAGIAPGNTIVTKAMTVEGKELKKSGFSLSTNTVKIPEMRKEKKSSNFAVQ